MSRALSVAVLLCATLQGGCAYLQTPRIDPTGEHIFATPPIRSQPRFVSDPGPRQAGDDVAVTLSPTVTVVPIGGEAVLIGGVLADDGYLITNRRLEWSISPESVGHFVAVEKNGFVDLLVGDFNRPRKIDNTFAVGSTSRKAVRLDRGTPTPVDDMCVLRGQGWVTLTSPVEGTSHVTVFAPSVREWGCRKLSAKVHWVDAQWQLPAPSINPAGTRHTLTTNVMRQTSETPCEGWIVRYEITGGPPAGFSPDGTKSIETVTDASGLASAEIFQNEAVHGTNTISVKIYRPASAGGPGGERLLVGSGMTTKTWSAPDIAVKVLGPANAGVGGTLTYDIIVSNPGDLPATGVVASVELPDALNYLSSTPIADERGRTLSWQVGEVGPGENRSLKLVCRGAMEGSAAVSANVTTAEGLSASGSLTTNVVKEVVQPPVQPHVAPGIDIKITGPTTAEMGDEVTFDILITNNAREKMSRLVIKDRFDPGLSHEAGGNSIEKEIPDMEAGQAYRISVAFKVVEAGELCHTVEVSTDDKVLAKKKACVKATGTPIVEPPSQASVSVTKKGPKKRKVGEKAEFVIDVTNVGTKLLSDVKVVDTYDPQLKPVSASGGPDRENGDVVWTISSLAPGETVAFDIHCECLEVAKRTCNRVTVTSREDARAESEACLEIEAAPVVPEAAKLRMEVGELLDPIGVGKELTYEIRITNESSKAEQQLVLTVTAPDGMPPVALGTFGPGSVKPDIRRQIVSFSPLDSIGPNETVTYRVRVSAQKAGQHQLRAELTSRNMPQPLVETESTEVLD